jgi:MSHA biogenesis protein MshM
MIYLAHFGLREAPFSLTPDTAFFYPHGSAQSALNTLLVALRQGEGFVKIVAEVGCGKTVLCRNLLAELRGEALTAYVPNPRMTPQNLLMALCEELAIDVAPADQHTLGPRHAAPRTLALIQRRLLAHAEAGRRVVLCIDEAQAAPVATIEALRLLSNLETEKRKLLQIVLFGQPELDARLARREIRQLQQRIAFSDRLVPMSRADVTAYVRHRLGVAGAPEAATLFEPRALALLARASGGVPRLVNLIAHKALMLAFGRGAARVSAAMLRDAIDDTPACRTLRPQGSWAGWLPWRSAAA